MAEALKFNPENTEREKTRQELLEKLKGLLEWDEEIPEKRIPSLEEKDFLRYKVRTAWFTDVLVCTELAIEQELLSRTLKDQYAELLTKCSSKEFRKRDHTREDIDEMNQFLIQVINELEQQDGGV